MLDSQPTHNQQFAKVKYSLIIDHHPEDDCSQFLTPDAFYLIEQVGATSTLMSNILQKFNVTPDPLLATALLYGIRTDTAAFERAGAEQDLNAYHWLSKYANMTLLRRICRSEYLRAWLPLFSRAFHSLRDCYNQGAHASLHNVDSADLLVCIADFFTKVHGLRWIAVSGICNKRVIKLQRKTHMLACGI